MNNVVDERKWAYHQAEGDWSVRGSYEEPDNVEFLYRGEVVQTITYPGYRIWNIAAHLHDYIPDLEEQRLSQAHHEAARAEAIKALKRFDPSLCHDYTDSWFGKVVDIVVDTYEEWTGER